MVQRLRAQVGTAEGKRLLKTLVLGKLIALFLLFVLFTVAAGLLGPGARAASDAHAPMMAVNAVNTIWTLIAAFLVFGMQIGFTMLECGLVRGRETVNVLMECIADTCICGIMFWAVGFAFMFSAGTPFIGTHWFFLNGAPDLYGTTGIPLLAYWLFQFAFADCASTITSGAMAGRTGFMGDILYSIGVTGFIYPIIGHWAWGPDGWLAAMSSPTGLAALRWVGAPFRDFAGSTVVHTIGGVVALAGAIVLGPRLGRVFRRDGGNPPPAHDMIIAGVGAMILWFGWYGFNPGSTVSAMDIQGISRVAANTTLAACAGALVAMFAMYRRTKIWDATYTINGFLAGLVAVTCPCYWISPLGSILLGAAAGGIVIVAVDALEWFRIDDPVGAVAVHMVCGIWGTLSLGLFACGKYGATGPMGADNSAPVAGLFYGGGFSQLIAQCIGSLGVGAAAFAAAFVLMKAVDALGCLRVSATAEMEGLDLAEHGGSAYPEYALNHLGTPLTALGALDLDKDPHNAPPEPAAA
jgi:Amt family ammonium transporter